MAKKENSLRNLIIGTIGSVVSTLIVTAVLYFVPSAWSATRTAATWLWYVITYSVSLPIWSLILIAVALLPTVHFVFKFFTTEPQKTWRDYTKDTFQQMVWRWSYSDYLPGVHNLWCYCPFDDTMLVYSMQNTYNEKIQFTCETCGRSFGPFSGNENYFLDSIKRQIDRKIRNDEWKAIVGIDTENSAT